MPFVSNWISEKHTRHEVDYELLGHSGAGLFFSGEFTDSGYDPFLDSLCLPQVVDPSTQFIDSINIYLTDDLPSEFLRFHFGDVLDVIRVLDNRARKRGQRKDLDNLNSLKHGFKLALTEFKDFYRLFFESYEAINSQWRNDRKLRGIPDGRWHPFDTESEFQLGSLKKTSFQIPINRFQDFVVHSTTPLLISPGTVLSSIGQGLLIEFYQQTRRSEMGELDKFAPWNQDDWLHYEDVCVNLTNAKCSKTHNHADSIWVLSLFLTADEFTAFL